MHSIEGVLHRAMHGVFFMAPHRHGLLHQHVLIKIAEIVWKRWIRRHWISFVDWRIRAGDGRRFRGGGNSDEDECIVKGLSTLAQLFFLTEYRISWGILDLQRGMVEVGAPVIYRAGRRQNNGKNTCKDRTLNTCSVNVHIFEVTCFGYPQGVERGPPVIGRPSKRARCT